MYLILVLIAALIILVLFSFLFSSVVENIQNAFNPTLDITSWATPEHYNTFYYAASLVTNIWTYVFVFIFFGLCYFTYTYSQRRGING